jgi:hypothetical protein
MILHDFQVKQQVDTFLKKDILTGLSSMSLADSQGQLSFPFFWFARKGSLTNADLPFSIISSCTFAGHWKGCTPDNGSI